MNIETVLSVILYIVICAGFIAMGLNDNDKQEEK